MTKTPFDLNGRIILVTGASSGIGRQVAISTAALGARLIVSGRNSERLEAVLKELSGEGHRMICGDLTQAAFVEELASFCGTLNGMVHCAGILRPFPIRFITEKEISDMFGINYNAAVLLSARLLRKRQFAEGASLVFISSVSGTQKPYYGGALYAGSKVAIESFSRILALEHAPKKIRSNCISPAIVKTPIFDEYMGGVADKENVDAYEKQYPLGFGEPEDVAAAAIYLLSDASRWVTGTTITLDGGLSLT